MTIRWLLVAAAATLLVSCSSSGEDADAYCAVVQRTAEVMADRFDPADSTSENAESVATKRAAMAELRDVAPAEIRGYWDTVYEGDGDLAETDLARQRIDAFEAEHCG